MVNMNNLINGKDSRWLQLEVCREFQRNKCTRPDTECKFAHPPANVEVLNGKVTACYDSIKVSFWSRDHQLIANLRFWQVDGWARQCRAIFPGPLLLPDLSRPSGPWKLINFSGELKRKGLSRRWRRGPPHPFPAAAESRGVSARCTLNPAPIDIQTVFSPEKLGSFHGTPTGTELSPRVLYKSFQSRSTLIALRFNWKLKPAKNCFRKCGFSRRGRPTGKSSENFSRA